MHSMKFATFLAAILVSVPLVSQVQKPLDIYFIDVEGGQATLVASPSGESMLIDTGWPGFDGRDAGRIVATAKQAGISKIDYLVITHYHTDHAGGVAANPLCAQFKAKDPDPSENARSVGTLLTFGRFRLIDLGDLTWNKEHDLVCPNNRLGTVDVYLTTHHGLDQSGAPVLVHALNPRVAVMNNGARKGGSPAAWQVVRSSPALEDLWQLHYAVDA